MRTRVPPFPSVDAAPKLCVCVCPRARACVYTGILQEDPELPVWGVDSDALETVLRCFYTGECHLTAANVVAVYDAAKRYARVCVCVCACVTCGQCMRYL